MPIRLRMLAVTLLVMMPLMAGAVQAQEGDHGDGSSSTGTAREKFQHAVELYRQADYDRAITLFEELERSGYGGYLLHYDIGNAYYKNGDLGRAILHFEKALMLRPGDADAIHNLKVVRARTRDRLEPVPLLFFVQWWNDVKTGYRAETFFTVSVILLWVLAAALFVFFGFRGLLVRRFALVGGIVFGVLFVLSGILYFSRVEQLNAHRAAVVMPDAATVRSTPDASGIESFVVHEGLKVHILDRKDDYYRIRLEDGKTGWIPSSALERI